MVGRRCKLKHPMIGLNFFLPEKGLLNIRLGPLWQCGASPGPPPPLVATSVTCLYVRFSHETFERVGGRRARNDRESCRSRDVTTAPKIPRSLLCYCGTRHHSPHQLGQRARVPIVVAPPMHNRSASRTYVLSRRVLCTLCFCYLLFLFFFASRT